MACQTQIHLRAAVLPSRLNASPCLRTISNAVSLAGYSGPSSTSEISRSLEGVRNNQHISIIARFLH
jgi:hypothetical protein